MVNNLNKAPAWRVQRSYSLATIHNVHPQTELHPTGATD